jgi:NhaP-type Na+/H+ or K+/H+ antiporter
MSDVIPFGVIIAVISVAGLLAVWSNRITERVRIPAPAIFLVAAAVASDFVPTLGRVPVVTVQRVVTVMLILLLLDGGMHIGWRRFRAAGGPVLSTAYATAPRPRPSPAPLSRADQAPQLNPVHQCRCTHPHRGA